jgi:hypothetical protein
MTTDLPAGVDQPARPRLITVLAVFAVVFGLMTIKGGGTVLFGGDAERAAAGQVVPFVLWFNFLAGFAYVAAGLGLWRMRPWAGRLALAVALASLAVGSALALHIATGGAYEMRTVAAMTLRCTVWGLIALATRRIASK